MGQFEQWLRQFEALWDVLDEVDSKCWVLEPENPTRVCTYRRVVIGERVVCVCVCRECLHCLMSVTLSPSLIVWVCGVMLCDVVMS